MSVLDKVLNVMHLNDDFDEDDDYLDEDSEDPDLDESGPGRRLIRRREEDTEEEVPEPDPRQPAVHPQRERRPQTRSSRDRTSRNQKSSSGNTSSPKVSSFRPRRVQSEEEQTNNYSVCVIRPKSMEDALEIAKTLLAGCVVILNLEGLDLDVSQRLFDFASGSCCALQGRLDKISNYIFVLTPRGIHISGEFQEIITGTFDPEDLDEDDVY